MTTRRTKIIATVGPAQDAPGALERLLDAGVDVLRINLSHASPRQQLGRVLRAREHRPGVAVLVDLGGPGSFASGTCPPNARSSRGDRRAGRGRRARG